MSSSEKQNTGSPVRQQSALEGLAGTGQKQPAVICKCGHFPQYHEMRESRDLRGCDVACERYEEAKSQTTNRIECLGFYLRRSEPDYAEELTLP